MRYEVILEYAVYQRGVFRVQAPDAVEAVKAAVEKAKAEPSTMVPLPGREQISCRNLAEDNGKA